jgi:hypothetical protein
MSLIRADDLEQWASSIAGRYQLGELVRRLVHASIPLDSIRRIHFLSDEANQLAGWDGVLDCDSRVPWVPNKTAVWELGAGGSNREKIRRDFAERLGRKKRRTTPGSKVNKPSKTKKTTSDSAARPERELPAGWRREETTYVAVTLRKLDDLDILENELKVQSPWNDVRSTTRKRWQNGSKSIPVSKLGYKPMVLGRLTPFKLWRLCGQYGARKPNLLFQSISCWLVAKVWRKN